MAERTWKEQVIVQIMGKDAGYNKLVSDATRRTDRFGKSLEILSTRVTNQFTKGLANMATAVSAFSKDMVVAGANFEQAITTLSAIKPSTSSSALAGLSDEARKLGATTAYTATEAAEGMQQLARAGFEANQVLAMTGPALYFAGANAITMDMSTKLLASSLKQFNLVASDSNNVLDVFTVATQNSLFDVESLAVAMRYGGSVGASLGRSLEETVAVMSSFRDLGLEGSMVGTRFRQAMLSLINPTAGAKKIIKDLGLTLEDVNPSIVGATEAIRNLGKAGATSPDALAPIVSKRAAGSVSKLAKDLAEALSIDELEMYFSKLGKDLSLQTVEDIANAEKQIGKSLHQIDLMQMKFQRSAGITARTYETMISTVEGQYKILTSAIQELQITTFKAFNTDVFRGTKKEIEEIGKTFSGTIPEINSFSSILEDLKKVVDDVTTVISFQGIETTLFFTEMTDKIKELVDTFGTTESITIHFIEMSKAIVSASLNVALFLNNFRFLIDLAQTFVAIKLGFMFKNIAEYMLRSAGAMTVTAGAMVNLTGVQGALNVASKGDIAIKNIQRTLMIQMLELMIVQTQAFVALTAGQSRATVATKTNTAALTTQIMAMKASVGLLKKQIISAGAASATIPVATVSMGLLGRATLKAAGFFRALAGALSGPIGLLFIFAPLLMDIFSGWSDIADEVEATTSKVNSLRLSQEAYNKSLATSAGGDKVDQQDGINALKQQLRDREEYTSVIRNELNLVKDLTDKKRQELLLEGKLFKVQYGKENILLSANAAQALRNTYLEKEHGILAQQEKIAESMTANADALNKKVKDGASGFTSLILHQKELNKESGWFGNSWKLSLTDLNDFNNILKETSASMGSVLVAGEKHSNLMSAIASKGLNVYSASDYSEIVKLSTEVYETLESQAKATSNQANVMGNALTDAIDRVTNAGQKRIESNKRIGKSNNDLNKAIESRLKLEEKLRKALEKAKAVRTQETLAIEYKYRIKELQKVYEKELALLKNNLEKKRALEARYANSVRMVQDTYEQKYLAGHDKMRERILQDIEESSKSEIGLLKSSHKEEIDEIKDKFKDEENLIKQQLGIRDDNSALSADIINKHLDNEYDITIESFDKKAKAQYSANSEYVKNSIGDNASQEKRLELYESDLAKITEEANTKREAQKDKSLNRLATLTTNHQSLLVLAEKKNSAEVLKATGELQDELFKNDIESMESRLGVSLPVLNLIVEEEAYKKYLKKLEDSGDISANRRGQLEQLYTQKILNLRKSVLDQSLGFDSNYLKSHKEDIATLLNEENAMFNNSLNLTEDLSNNRLLKMLGYSKEEIKLLVSRTQIAKTISIEELKIKKETALKLLALDKWYNGEAQAVARQAEVDKREEVKANMTTLYESRRRAIAEGEKEEIEELSKYNDEKILENKRYFKILSNIFSQTLLATRSSLNKIAKIVGGATIALGALFSLLSGEKNSSSVKEFKKYLAGITRSFSAFGARLEKTGSETKDFFKGLGDGVKGVSKSGVTNITTLFAGIISLFKEGGLKKGFSSLSKGLGDLGKSTKEKGSKGDLLKGLVGGVNKASKALGNVELTTGGGLAGMASNTKAISGALSAIGGKLGAILGGVASTLGYAAIGVVVLGKALGKILGVVGKAISKIVELSKQAFDYITGGFNLNVFTAISNITSDIISQQTAAIDKAKSDLESLEQQLLARKITKEEYDEARAGGIGSVDEVDIQGETETAVNELFKQAEMFMGVILQVAPRVMEMFAEKLPALFTMFKNAAISLLGTIEAYMPNLVISFVDSIFRIAPSILSVLQEVLPSILTFATNLIVKELPALANMFYSILLTFGDIIISSLPDIVTAIIKLVPTVTSIIQNMLKIFGVVVKEVIKNADEITKVITDAIGPILATLADQLFPLLASLLSVLVKWALSSATNLTKFAIDLIVGFMNALPDIITKVIDLLPLIIEELILSIGDIIIAIVMAIPQIIHAIIILIPTLIASIIKLIPDIIGALVSSIGIVGKTMFDSFTSGIWDMFTDIGKQFGEAFKDTLFKNDWLSGLRDTNNSDDDGSSVGGAIKDWFGRQKDRFEGNASVSLNEYNDTPYALRAGLDGFAAKFAAGDYIVAAQNPAGLLQQALDNFINTTSSRGSFSGMESMGNSGGAMPPIDIAVIAEGRLLDAVQITALDRGHAPRMERKLRRASGVNVGFDRGRFNNFGR